MVNFFYPVGILKNIVKLVTMNNQYHIQREKDMPAYRTHMKIVGDILTTTRDDVLDDQGTTVTCLIRKANISYGRLSKILDTLVEQGLLEQTNSKRACKYKISSRGREFLSAYTAFNEFAQNFGLRI